MSDPGRLSPAVLVELDRALAPTDALLAARYPGAGSRTRPVHTVYVPAHQVQAGVCAQWGREALVLLAEHAPAPGDWTQPLEIDETTAAVCLERVAQRLAERPIDDLRLDFEDGYGRPAGPGEDDDARRAGVLLATLADQGSPPNRAGLRVRSMDAGLRARAARVLDLVVGAAQEAGGLPATFVVTLPKVRAVAQVEAMGMLCAAVEQAHGLPADTIRLELQVESPAVVVDAEGRAALAPALHAAGERLLGLHYGAYDYSAAIGVSAAHQSTAHPAADHAKAVMLAAAAETGAEVSDGSTQVLPVGSHAQVMAAWAYHAGLVRRALVGGLYQGWDLHPGHLVSRHLATTAFFRAALPAAAARLARYAAGAAGGHLDEPATAQALAGVLVRGVDAGAVDLDEVLAATGLDAAQLHAHHERRSA